jgi:hypothetical protein
MEQLALIYYNFPIGIEVELHTIFRAGFTEATALTYVFRSSSGKHSGTNGTNYADANMLLDFYDIYGKPVHGHCICRAVENTVQQWVKSLNNDLNSMLDKYVDQINLAVRHMVLNHNIMPVIYYYNDNLLQTMIFSYSDTQHHRQVVDYFLFMVAALVGDAWGMHAMFGVFVFGLAVPSGLVDVVHVDDFGVGTPLPPSFTVSCLSKDIAKVTNTHLFELLMVATAILKEAVMGGMAGASEMPLHDDTSIGVLLGEAMLGFHSRPIIDVLCSGLSCLDNHVLHKQYLLPVAMLCTTCDSVFSEECQFSIWASSATSPSNSLGRRVLLQRHHRQHLLNECATWSQGQPHPRKVLLAGSLYFTCINFVLTFIIAAFNLTTASPSIPESKADQHISLGASRLFRGRECHVPAMGWVTGLMGCNVYWAWPPRYRLLKTAA